MKLILWLAQLIIDILQAKNYKLSEEMKSLIEANEEYEAAVAGLKIESQLYKASLQAIQSHNESLLYKIEQLKLETGLINPRERR